jgi:tRNA G46 methylase TrmB
MSKVINCGKVNPASGCGHVITGETEEELLKNTAAADGAYAPKPDYRPLTKFENRGIKLGHGVWDLLFIRA